MVGVEVGIKTGGARPEIEYLDLTQLGQFVKRLVDGLERDARHPTSNPIPDRFRRRVLPVVLEHLEDPLTLRSDLAALGPETGGDLVG